MFHLAKESTNRRSNRPDVFSKIGVLRNFAKFTGKRLCQSLFFNKVAGLVLQKREFGTGVFCEFCEISQNTFLYRRPPVAASVIEHLQSEMKIVVALLHPKMCCECALSFFGRLLDATCACGKGENV